MNSASEVESRLNWWYSLNPSEMRLHGGEMTDQEIRTVKAILKNILEYSKEKEKNE